MKATGGTVYHPVQGDVTNQVKAFEQFSFSLWMKSSSVTIQMKATEQSFPVVLFIMVVLPFESVDEILKCDHSDESYREVNSFLWYYLLCCTRWF